MEKDSSIIEINSSKDYNIYIVTLCCATLFILALLYLWKGGNLWSYIFFEVVLIIAFLSKKRARKISIFQKRFNIFYKQWGINKTLTLVSNNIELKTSKRITPRAGGEYYQLKFIDKIKRKTVFSVSTFDGFEVEDFLKLQNLNLSNPIS